MQEKINEIKRRWEDLPSAIGREAKEDIGVLVSKVEGLKKALAHIIAMAGNPSAADGCRAIIKRALEEIDG